MDVVAHAYDPSCQVRTNKMAFIPQVAVAATAALIPLAPSLDNTTVAQRPTAAVNWGPFTAAQYSAFLYDLSGPQYFLGNVQTQFINQAELWTLPQANNNLAQNGYDLSTYSNWLANPANSGKFCALLALGGYNSDGSTAAGSLNSLFEVVQWGMTPSEGSSDAAPPQTTLQAAWGQETGPNDDLLGTQYVQQPTQPYGLKLVPENDD